MMTTLWPGRLFRIELRRDATWVLLPLLGGLLWIASPYGRALKAPVVLWSSRSLALQSLLDQATRAICGLAPVQDRGGVRLAKAPSAQLDVALGLEAVAGEGVPPAVPAPVAAAARHFAGLPEPVRRGWLAAHLTALRAGQITLAELP